MKTTINNLNIYNKMNRNEIIVPKGIRYVSEWNEFNFSKFPEKCIINKQLPGCGFTEYCLRGSENVILCSPRKMLLENKKDQHENEVYLVVNEMEKEVEIDKDISKEPKNAKIEDESIEKRIIQRFMKGSIMKFLTIPIRDT